MTRAYIFDLDGTLLDNSPIYGAAWASAFATVGVQTDVATYLNTLAGLTSAQTVRVFLPDADDALITTLSDRTRDRYRALIAGNAREIPGAHAFVQAAHARGIRLGVASNSSTDTIDRMLRVLGMRDCFSVLTSGNDVAHGKPAPDIYLLAAQRLGVAAADCLAFEDSRNGVAAAHAAGMCVTAISRTHGAEVVRALPGVVSVIDAYPGEK